jgi:hypothetical protein
VLSCAVLEGMEGQIPTPHSGVHTTEQRKTDREELQKAKDSDSATCFPIHV